MATSHSPDVQRTKDASRSSVPSTGLRAAAAPGGSDTTGGTFSAQRRPQGPHEPLSIHLLTEATRLWGRYRRGELTYYELDRLLVALEKRYGVSVESWGDRVDRAWDDYKDRT